MFNNTADVGTVHFRVTSIAYAGTTRIASNFPVLSGVLQIHFTTLHWKINTVCVSTGPYRGQTMLGSFLSVGGILTKE